MRNTITTSVLRLLNSRFKRVGYDWNNLSRDERRAMSQRKFNEVVTLIKQQENKS